MFGCSKLHFPQRCFGCSKLQPTGHLLGWWCHWSPKNGGCRTRFFCFSPAAALFGLRKFGRKKSGTMKGMVNFFASTFWVFVTSLFWKKLTKNELKPKSTPWIYPQPMTTMANKGLYSIGSIGDIPRSPQKWFHVGTPHEVSPASWVGGY